MAKSIGPPNPPDPYMQQFLELALDVAQGSAHLTSFSAMGSAARGIDEFRYEIIRPQHVSMSKPAHPAVQTQALTAALQKAAYAYAFGTSLPHTKSKAIEDLGTGIEPIVGYRDFSTWGGPYDPVLCSRNSQEWPMREPLLAMCRVNNVLQATHDAPEMGCQCGIYAYDSPKHPDLQQDAEVWGEINMWGNVLICETGYRAEYAYPKTLFVRDTGTKVIKLFASNLEKAYGVPVMLVKERDGKTMSELMSYEIERLALGYPTIITPEGGES